MCGIQQNQDQIQSIVCSNFGDDTFETTPRQNYNQFAYYKINNNHKNVQNIIDTTECSSLFNLNVNCQQQLEILNVTEDYSSYILYKNLVIPNLHVNIQGSIPQNKILTLELKCFGRRRNRELSQTSYGCEAPINLCQYYEVQFQNEAKTQIKSNSNGNGEFKSIRFSQYNENAAINLIQPFVPLEFSKRLEYKKNSGDIQKEIIDQGINGFMEFISNSNIRHKQHLN